MHVLCRAVLLQVAGYVVDYNSGLSYATVKGAGHMVPETNPREALDMFSRFIAGQALTDPQSTESVSTQQGIATS
jgi:carboxypeptidase C (cathepsin A)